MRLRAGTPTVIPLPDEPVPVAGAAAPVDGRGVFVFVGTAPGTSGTAVTITLGETLCDTATATDGLAVVVSVGLADLTCGTAVTIDLEGTGVLEPTTKTGTEGLAVFVRVGTGGLTC